MMKGVDSDGNCEYDPSQITLPKDYQLKDLDICCGRGKRSWNHPGNQLFQKLVQLNAERYQDASSKNEKSLVVASIVTGILNSGGRFVKRLEGSGRWLDIGETNARDKTGHAIRDFISNRSKRREKQTAVKFFKSNMKSKKTADCKAAEGLVGCRSARKETPDTGTVDDTHSRLYLPPLQLSFDASKNFSGLGILDLVDLAVEQSWTDDIIKPKLIAPKDLLSHENMEVCALLSDDEEDEASKTILPFRVDMMDHGSLLPEDWL